ncbi:MAG: hypothetical protein J1F01_04715 [Oscillospiraceae bacterium]|nr:hypothetical protein [Oscillospiraceae bacterium]
MKKYYAILGICGALFALCAAVLIFNPDSHRLITGIGRFGTDITTSSTGDALLMILGIVVIIAIVIAIVYKIFKFISKLINKITGKKNKEDFYTKDDNNKNNKGSDNYVRVR